MKRRRHIPGLALAAILLAAALLCGAAVARFLPRPRSESTGTGVLFTDELIAFASAHNIPLTAEAAQRRLVVEYHVRSAEYGRAWSTGREVQIHIRSVTPAAFGAAPRGITPAQADALWGRLIVLFPDNPRNGEGLDYDPATRRFTLRQWSFAGLVVEGAAQVGFVTFPLAGFIWWLQRRRGRSGSCRRCGYDLTGLPTHAVCPECGRPRRGDRNATRETAL